MAISLPGSQASYDFQNPQQCAIHLRLTPEVKEALLQAQQQGGQASLQLTGHAADNALHIGGQSFALSAPIAQERLDVFKLSQHGCVQVGHIQQKSVVKRSGLQPANKQHGQPVTSQDHSDHAVRHSKGSLRNGVALPQIQAVKPPVQRLRTDYPSGTAHTAHVSVPAAPVARQHKTQTSHTVSAAPTAKPVWPHTGQHSLQEPSVHVQQHKQSLPNGTHTLTDSRHPSADPKQPQQSSQHAPPGSSLQSAQTALPQKVSKGKSAKAPTPAAASMLSEEVVQQVCAAARIGQKETVLIALLQCKPCKNQVLEAVLKEAEKRVPGFQRLQGESLKRACRSYGEMKPGNKWALQAQYVQQAHSILDRIQNLSPADVVTQMQHPSGPDKARKSIEPQPGVKRKRSAEPQPPSGAPEGYPSTDDGSDKAKKRKAVEPGLLTATGPQQRVTGGLPGVTKTKKRLRKAGDMERESQSEESDRAAHIGLKQSLQVAGLEDSDSEDGAIPGSHGPGRHVTQDSTHVTATAAARRPPPGPHQRSTSPVDSQQWQAGLHRATTADAQVRQTAHTSSLQRDGTLHGHDRHATDYMHTQAEHMHGPFDHDRRRTEHAAGPSRHSSDAEHAVHAGFAKSGNLTGDLTGLNAQMEDHDAGPSGSALDEGAPAVGKIKLKIRRPVSAASEAYDESWFAEHLDRQPELQAPIQDLMEWEQCLHRYESKRGTYFRLHQEMLDLKIKVTGLQQAIQESPDEAEKALLQQQFQSYWDKRLHRSQRWDKAFTVLHLELQALFSSLQSFYDMHAHSDEG